jgi:outer membrane protein TolC
MTRIFTFFLISLSCLSLAQNTISNEFTFNEYLGFVKKFHPLVQNANLEIDAAQAELLMARGGFDPKIEVDFDKKQFKNSEYYSILNSSFKIPTWYGVEIKAGFDNSEGIFLNPEHFMPNSGLTSLGIMVPIGQGLFINQRMADLQKARINLRLGQAQRKLEAIEVLYDASEAYFNWKRAFSEVELYENYNAFAEIRLQGIRILIEQGDKPAIDSVEAGIIVTNRRLNLEDSRLKLMKAKLQLSNFLWLENKIPLEINDILQPESNLNKTIQQTLLTNDLLSGNFSIDGHPKIDALERKIDILNVERRFKANMLLPKLNLSYDYLSEPAAFQNFRTQDYKVGLNFYFPIFLRKERGALRLTKIKLEESTSILNLERVQLTNKIAAQKFEISSLIRQRTFIENLVNSNSTMLNAEERLFTFGESSLFLINARENNLVLAQLNRIALEYRYYLSNAELFRVMANPD